MQFAQVRLVLHIIAYLVKAPTLWFVDLSADSVAFNHSNV